MELLGARARVGGRGDGGADDDHLWLQRKYPFESRQLDAPGDSHAGRGQRLAQFRQLREGRTERRLLIVRGVQAEQIAAHLHQLHGASPRISDLHHIKHCTLVVRPRALKGACDRGVSGQSHDRDDIGAGAECDIGFRAPGIHNLEIRHQRKLRMRPANAPQGIHPLAENERRPYLGNVYVGVDSGQDIQRRRQVAIQRDLQLRHKQPIGSRTGENRTQYSIVNRRASIKEADMTAKIVVVGSFNADLVSYIERMPRPGETVHGDRFATGAGGKGSNQAVAAARLGADVSFIGRLGNDVFANLAYEIWDAEGVNHDFVSRDNEVATGVAPILVDSSGENMIVVVLGANRRLRRSDIDAARARIAAADMLVVQLEVNLDMVPYALKTAKKFGVTTILNPAPAAAISPETIQLADYLTPNETELETLTGGADDVVSAARALLTRPDQMAVVTLGEKGAQIVTADNTLLVPTFAVDAVDTTGAGDTFNAALAVGLSEGMALERAVRFANAAAALCVTKPGAADSVPYRADVDALILGQE